MYIYHLITGMMFRKNCLHFIVLVILSVGSSTHITAQIAVCGTISDSITQQKITDAYVHEFGKYNGVLSTLNGEYFLNIADINAILVFKLYGYVSYICKVGQRSVIDVKLQDTTSYKKLVPPMPKIADVQLRANSDFPKPPMNIVIRGIGGIDGDPRPMYIIDGIPVGKELTINPDEIESISILKDNSSCSLPEIRGNNGVILVTTKQGSYNYNKPYGYEAIPKYLYGSESDFKKKIVKQLELQAAQHTIKEQIIVICTINEKGEIHVLKTNIEKDYIFNQYLISALENSVQWYPARQNGKDVESLNMFVFDFNEK
jgi:TonB-dependent SusC/RagA subfamily outer membrane receptor